MMIRIARDEVLRDPFPHVARQPFLDPALFERLRAEYPTDGLFERNTNLHARAGRDLYRGDPVFDEFLAGSPAWREFYGWVNSPAYLRLVVDLFGEDFERFGCRVDPGKTSFSDFVEPREALYEAKGLSRVVRRLRETFGTPTDPNEMFVRFDLGQARAGYAKDVHCDLPNRLVSMIMYFSDTEEEGLQGGDLRLHEHVDKRALADYERYPREERTRVIATLRPRKNLGVLFLCSNNSYHSVTAMRGEGRRNFTYFNVSSRASRIW